MSESTEGHDVGVPEPSIDDLRAAVRLDSSDLEARRRLLDALVARHMWGTDKVSPGIAEDLEEARALVAELPLEWTAYERAYITFRDGDEEAVSGLVPGIVAEWCATFDGPPDSSAMMNYFVYPFQLSAKGWQALSEGFEGPFPDSASVWLLRALAFSEQKDAESAISALATALARDETYWLAAWFCAQEHMAERNWRAARRSFERALESDEAQQWALLHFEAALCAGRLRDYGAEEQHYRACVKIAPGFQYAHNNLGWALYKQKRYAEAIAVFDAAIAQGTDGPYPQRNKVEALIRLGQLDEAEGLLRELMRSGGPKRFVERRLDRIEQMRLSIQVEELVPEEDEPDEFGPTEDEAGVAGATGFESEVETSSEGTLARERWLEEALEAQILRTGQAFERPLRMYDGIQGYGRQLPLPDVGIIDLLAENPASGDLVVIELKRDRAHQTVIDQISPYMEWVQRNVAEQGQTVRGIICAREISPALQFAAQGSPVLELYEYGVVINKVS